MELALERVGKRFGHVAANADVTVTFATGRIHGILGENGAGKSTLMRILAGRLAPDQGRLTVDGKGYARLSPALARDLGVGMLAQDPLDFPALTVLENFILGGPSRPLGQARSRLAELSGRFGFAFDPASGLSRLTVAERQQLELLRLFDQNTRALILDEPTTGIAPAHKEALFDILRRFAAESGNVVLMVTHKLAEAQSLCHDITVMRHGRVVGRFEPPYDPSAILASMFGPADANRDGLALGQPRAGGRGAAPCSDTPGVPTSEAARSVWASARPDGPERSAGPVSTAETAPPVAHRANRQAKSPVAPRANRQADPAGEAGRGGSPAAGPEAGGAAGGQAVVVLSDAAFSAEKAFLPDLTLCIGPGEIVGLAGVAGSGQEIFLRGLCGLARAVKGDIRVRGRSLAGAGLSAFLAAGARFLPAARLEEGLFGGLSLLDHVVLAHRESRARARDFFNRRSVGRFGVPDKPDLPAASLSGGNQQRLLLSLVPDDTALLLAEGPTRGLDAASTATVWERLTDLAAGKDGNRRGAAVVFSSDDLDEILERATRVLVFYNGGLTADLPAAEAGLNRLGALMTGREAA